MKKLITVLALLILVAATYCTLSESWIAPRINAWQAKIMGDNDFFPALTIFIMALPPLLVLAAIKLLLQRSSFGKQ